MEIKKINLAIEEQLHRALKLKATQEGKPLYQFIVEVLSKEAKQNDD